MRKTTVFSGLLTLLLSGVLFLPVLPQAAAAAGDGWQVYFGQLHSHSGYLDRVDAPAQVFSAAKAAGMDFFALTDYSHSFENGKQGSIQTDGTAISATWAEGKRAANAATTSTFAAMYGYEMSWFPGLRLGHIATFATPGWQCMDQEGFDDLPSYYEALASVPNSIGQFCHPCIQQGTFDSFRHHSWEADKHMTLLEVSGENGRTFYDQYQKALDQGWHVAPTASAVSHQGNWDAASQVRTAIVAKGLSEDSLYEAMCQRRVYATEDADLSVLYFLGGNLMGSRVTNLQNYQATIHLSDPTDGITGKVEVITARGRVLLTENAAAEMELTLPSGHSYYYLRITQADRDVAVTAPVWIEAIDDLGISSFTCSASVPVQSEEADFSFTVYNQEQEVLVFSSLRLVADGTQVWAAEAPVTLAPGQRQTITVPYTHTGAGTTRFRCLADGAIAGQAVSFEKSLTLSFRPAILTAQILVDGRHSAVTYDSLENLTALAAGADMDVAIFREETPSGGRVMIVPAADRDFSETYPQLLRDFVENGGHLILCGAAGNNDRMNGLLRYLGSSMAFHNDTALDPVHNGGTPDSLYPDVFNEEASCWENLTREQFYIHKNGCTLDPGRGTWLVKGKDTMEGDGDVLLAMEQIGRGQLYIAGSFFMADSAMPQPKNQWDPSRANQVLMENILNIQRSRLALSPIRDVRTGEDGGIFRVKGYVTAGTSDPWNRFPEMIYLQDSSGGIGITHFEISDIEVGFCLDIVGQRYMDGENPALKLVSCQVVKEELHRFDPAVSGHADAMDYDAHGGELLRIEGTAEAVEYTANGLGVSRFILRDGDGVPARVLVEDYIFSGAYGTNRLAEQVMDGKNVRAYGILHREADGTTVLRVRNCDEVVHIPPIPEVPEAQEHIPDLSNPKTGDWMHWLLYFF